MSKGDYESFKSKIQIAINKYSLHEKVKDMVQNDLSNRTLWDLFWLIDFKQKDYEDAQIISSMKKILKEITK